MKIDNPFEKTVAFHKKFDNRIPLKPTAFTSHQASARVDFTIEELVELLYASADNNSEVFNQAIENMKVSITKAEQKVLNKKKKVENPLVEQVDALTDLLYFTYGSFTLLGVDPTEIFSLVHQANMGKLFPDGQPHYDPETHKVLKPANWEADFAPEAKIKAEIQKQLFEKVKTATDL